MGLFLPGAAWVMLSKTEKLFTYVSEFHCTHLEEDLGVAEPPAVVEGLVLLEDGLGARLHDEI